MTRENKLALIIGFGLILVVGILVSDHFSAASRQKSADFTAASQPVADNRLYDPDFLTPISTSGDEQAGASGLNRGPLATSGTEAGADPGQRDGSTSPPPPGPSPGPREVETSARDNGDIVLPDQNELIRQDRAGTPHDPSLPEGFRWYSVQAKETLASICRREYGDEKLWRRLAELNSDRIANPNIVPLGVTIRLPSRGAMGVRTANAGGEETQSGAVRRVQLTGGGERAKAESPATRSYKIKSGETLSEVAKRFLGAESKWRELYEMNKDVIRNPDRVPVGTTIRVPAAS